MAQVNTGGGGVPGGANFGGTWSGIGTPRGWLYALDADTGAIAWRFNTVDAVLSGITPTAGGIVMALPDDVIAAAAANNAPDPIRGRDYYFRNCGVCHGAEGDTWHGIELKSVKHKMTIEALVEFIKNPRAPMPRTFPMLLDANDEREISNIAAFIMQWC